jgi:hypothetical protein
MAVIKREKLTEKQIDELINIRNLLSTDLDWCKWAGWFDTDGYFWKDSKTNNKRAGLSLKDKEPVEMLSNLFETSLLYRECKTITPEPYRYHYIAKIFYTYICGKRAECLTKNVFPYLLKEDKKDFATRLLGYRPESKPLEEWTKEEVVNYVATAVDGDGHIILSSQKPNHRKSLQVSVSSSDCEYLSKLKFLIDKHFNLDSSLKERKTYQTKKGIKTKYSFYLKTTEKGTQELLNLMSKENLMTIPRKRDKIVRYLNQ